MSGMIKFGPHLREMRLHLCQTTEASKGVREFIEKYYVQIKSTNPKFPILIRECAGTQPRLWVRYGKGKESCIDLQNLKADDVLQQMQKLGEKC